MPGSAPGPAPLGEDALAEIAATLADLYQDLYGEQALRSHASLTGNMLAWVFRNGLNGADKRIAGSGEEDVLKEFRRGFLEVIGRRLERAVEEIAGVSVDYSFFGFDPRSRTTHAIFILRPA